MLLKNTIESFAVYFTTSSSGDFLGGGACTVSVMTESTRIESTLFNNESGRIRIESGKAGNVSEIDFILSLSAGVTVSAKAGFACRIWLFLLGWALRLTSSKEQNRVRTII
ncbi:hypothetical protein Cfast33896_23780 [Coprobacter fastidiosus]|nr:hypothetical protein Cfast33896_23780 [Coprobacter fastidiosus]